jgi:hypothetical protein
MKAKILIWLKYNWLTYRKWLWRVLAILCVLTMAYVLGRCSTRQERINQNSNILALNSEVQSNLITIEGLEHSVQEKRAIILSQNQAIESGVVERELLKKLHIKDLVTNTELNGTIQVLRDSLKMPPGTIFITVKDTIEDIQAGITHDYVRLPFDLLKMDEKYLKLDAGMKVDRSAWFSLSVPFTGYVTVGYKKDGLFKTKPVGVFTTDNPYIKISDMNTVIVQENKSIFSKWWFNMLIGFGVGAGTGIAILR